MYSQFRAALERILREEIEIRRTTLETVPVVGLNREQGEVSALRRVLDEYLPEAEKAATQDNR